MRGLKVDHLVAMMDFLYSGEAKVLQENLDNFLAFANELQLKDLIGDQNINDDVKHSLSPKKGLEEGFFSQVKPSLQRIGQIQAETFNEREVKNKPKRTDFVYNNKGTCKFYRIGYYKEGENDQDFHLQINN